MTNPAITQSQKRFQESIGALFSKDAKNPGKQCLFLKSSTDFGVIRNGGRNGARFAPQSFLSTFKKFSQNEILKEWNFVDIEVSSPEEEAADFHRSQDIESEKITAALKEYPDAFLCHIGGGHDHAYPFLKSLSAKYKKVIVINIDAHADTRTDGAFHSGTPFRQFSDFYKGEFKLFQIGLHPFANTFSTLSPLNSGEMNILWKKDLSESSLIAFFKNIKDELNQDTLVVFSIDADALEGSLVPGVSAVNPDGLTRNELLLIWSFYRNLSLGHKPVMGIYELNPVYDTLASLSMRTLGSFVFEVLDQR